MAIVLEFDGVDDRLDLDSQISFLDTDNYVIVLKAKIDASVTSGSITFLFGTSSGNSLYYNVGSGFVWRIGGSTLNRSFASGVGIDLVITLTKTSGNHNLDINGVSSNFGLNRSYNIMKFGEGFDRFEGQLSSIVVTGSHQHDWDANTSNHGAGTPVITDSVSGNDFTGVNMPTAALGQPGSAWIDLGGGGIFVTGLLNSNYMVEYSMKKNIAGQSIGAQMITISDGSNFTGTVAAEVTIDNGTKTAGGGSVTHEGDGYHSYAPTQAETNGDHIAVSFAGTGALSQTVQVYTTFPQSVDNNTAIAALNDFNPASDTVANVALVATTTTNTDMRGTDSANTVVPASLAQFNARSLLSANYALEASISALNDFNPASDTVANVTLVATTTTNADMRGTDGANTVIPPTVTEFNARTLPTASYSQFDFAVNEVSADTVKVNGASVLGNGTAANLWRG